MALSGDSAAEVYNLTCMDLLQAFPPLCRSWAGSGQASDLESPPGLPRPGRGGSGTLPSPPYSAEVDRSFLRHSHSSHNGGGHTPVRAQETLTPRVPKLAYLAWHVMHSMPTGICHAAASGPQLRTGRATLSTVHLPWFPGCTHS